MIATILGFLRGFSPVSMLMTAGLLTLGGVSAWQAISNARISAELAECRMERKALEADVAIHHAKVSELLAAIAEQNAEVARIADETAAKLEAAKRVAEMAAERRVKQLAEIADLARAEGVSCADGVALIDLELGL